MKFIITMCIAFINVFVFAQNSKEFFIKNSYLDFEQTTNKLKNCLENKNIEIFAVINHQENAQKVSLKMSKSVVYIFGNPKAGTNLMLENPFIAIDLPLKIAVIEDHNKNVQVYFLKSSVLRKKHKIKNKELLNNIQTLLEQISNYATQ